MDDGTPTLEVGFAIDMGGSLEELTRLEGLIDTATASAIAEFSKMENAAKSVSFGGATASITSFGNATTRSAQDAAANFARVEKAGESLLRQLDKQVASFGKTRAEIQAMKVDAAALAAEQAGNTDLAQRLTAASTNLYDMQFAAQRKAAQEAQALAEDQAAAEVRATAAAAAEAQAIREAAAAHQLFETKVRLGVAAMREEEAAQAALAQSDEAQRLREAAFAYQQFEARVRQGAAALREQEAAQESDAAAVARLRAMLDPAAAAQQRLNDEITEARRVMTAAGADAEELARVEQMLKQQLQETGSSSGAQRAAVQNLGFQVQDFAVQVVGGTSALRAFAQQFPQAAGAMMGMEGRLGTIGAFLNGPLGIGLTLAITLLAGFGDKLFASDDAAKKAAEGLKTFQNRQSEIGSFIDATTGRIREQNQELIRNGVLTRQKQIDANAQAIKDQTEGAFRKAQNVAATTITVGLAPTRIVDPDVQKVLAQANGDISKLDAGLQALSARRPDLKATIQSMSDAAASTVYLTRENQRLGQEVDMMTGKTTRSSSAIIERQVALATSTDGVSAAQAHLDEIRAQGHALDTQFFSTEKDRTAAFAKYKTDLTTATNALHAAQQAKKDDTAATREWNKEQNHEAELARQAAAIESQIRNLYRLGDAYGVSGAAALVAEAREKAESEAIKHRGDADAEISRQVRLAIAQRVASSAQATASMGDQAAAQARVNDMVEAGLLPAARAAQEVKDQMADLPLLQAIQAAQLQGLATEAAKATAQLDAQRVARVQLRTEEARAQVDVASVSDARQLATQEEELRLIGATDAARVHALATLKATQDVQDKIASGWSSDDADAWGKRQVEIADAQQKVAEANADLNRQLRTSADLADSLGDSLSKAFGKGGAALGDMVKILGSYGEKQAEIDKQAKASPEAAAAAAKQSADFQITSLIGITDAAKGLFKEHSKGYAAMEAAEKALTIVQLARTAVDVAGGAARMFASLGPFAFPAVAAMLGVMAALGFSGGGSGVSQADYTKGNDGSGTVLGDTTAKSDSLSRSIDQLKDIDQTGNTFAREMTASLKSIDSQIGNLATVLVRSNNLDADSSVASGFKTSAIGSVLSNIPIIGGLLGSLFGTKTTVVGSGIYGGAQSIGQIEADGLDAQTYSDVQKKKKFLGITTSTKYSTVYGGDIDSSVSDQFGLILKSFDDAIVSAAGPLGASTTDIAQKVSNFVFTLGKIDLKDLTGDEIQEKLEAVFGAAADDMATAAFPFISEFQKVGEGAFETLTRVASTVEAVTTSLDELGLSSKNLSIEAKMGIADQFDSVSDMQSSVDSYFQSFYSKAEQASAVTAQLGKVFDSLGVAMPDTIAGFRALVDAQDLTTAAGQATYAALLQLAPTFANLETSLLGAKSAADVLSEREDLQRQLLEAEGDTGAVRALDLAKVDASNQALQQQVWAVQDAKDAASAASQLADAWKSVGDSITDEINRIRGLSDTSSSASFASLLGQFNAATTAARAGDQDAAKSLPSLSQSLLSAAADAATSRQELNRIQAQTAASLSATNATISRLAGGTAESTVASSEDTAAATTSSSTSSTDDLLTEIAALRGEVAQLRTDNNAGHAQTASNTGAIKKTMDNVTLASGGNAVSVAA